MGEDRRAHRLVDQWCKLFCTGEQNRVMTSGLVCDEVEHFEFDQGQVLVSSPLGVGARVGEQVGVEQPLLRSFGERCSRIAAARIGSRVTIAVTPDASVRTTSTCLLRSFVTVSVSRS